MDVHFFYSFWWLIFPVGWMFLRAFHMIGHYNHRNEVLKLLKSYADQGKEPPSSLLETLKHDDRSDYDDHWRGRRRFRGYRGRFSSFIVFAALAAGFGYAGYSGLEPSVFNALAIAFSVASVLMLVLGVLDFMTRPKP